ncbi:MAG: uroporphyrinogen decarboxylase family protein [Nitrososphaeria archaeon]
MTPKERVIAALNHEEPDKVPIDLGNTISSIHIEAYKDLLRHISLKEDKIFILDPVARSTRPSETILRRFRVDTRYIYPKLIKVDESPPPETVDIWGIRRKFTGYYYDVTKNGSPLMNADNVYEVNSYPWPKIEDMNLDLEDMISQAEKLAKSEYAVGFPYIVVGSFAHSLLVRGYQKFLSDTILRPKIAEAVIEKISDLMVEFIKKYVSPIGRYLDFIFFGDDLGTQTGPILSPQAYRWLVKPRHRKIIDAFKSATNAKVIIHSDGAITPLIPDLIDVGISGINPVQVSAKGMDSSKLKAEFGDRLIFWGAVDTQRVLPFGTPLDVRNEVQLRINDLAHGGGYVLASVHNIQPLTPPQNIISMFEEANRYGLQFYMKT